MNTFPRLYRGGCAPSTYRAPDVYIATTGQKFEQFHAWFAEICRRNLFSTGNKDWADPNGVEASVVCMYLHRFLLADTVEDAILNMD
jgi:hypothetical protein